MNNKDELIAKLERENSYLKSLLKQNGISYEEPKEMECLFIKNNSFDR